MNHDRAVAVLLSELLPAAAEKAAGWQQKPGERSARAQARLLLSRESSGISRRPSACGELGYSDLTTAQGHCHFRCNLFSAGESAEKVKHERRRTTRSRALPRGG